MIAEMKQLETVKEIRIAIRQSRYVFVTINPVTGTIARISKAEAVHLLREYESAEHKPIEWRKIDANLYIDPAHEDE